MQRKPMQRKPLSIWSATPPAVFTPILGLFGLGMAWRRGAEAYGLPDGIGEAILGAVSLAWAFFAILWLSKPLRRPSLYAEELRVLPGRSGLAAGGVGAIVLALALVPVAPDLARVTLIAALVWQAVFAASVAVFLLRGPVEQRVVSPVFHLTFAGFIVAPLAAVPLGWTGLATGILIASLIVAGLVYAISLRQLLTRTPPPPMRPLLAIHLSPLSLGGLGAMLLGRPDLSLVFLALATAVAVALLIRMRWLTETGFTPFWGAFTFPAAAYASLLAANAAVHPLIHAAGLVALAGISVAIPWIAFRILRQWPGGRLAQSSGAAVV